uniref:Uncharacterized protein n=1 Tax=Oryza sativa subsp. japonica TaxID=39947 RepID=Q6K9E4_ORYSJ|nr:hypothetical protein [Oryza sativa Japonica Group]
MDISEANEGYASYGLVIEMSRQMKATRVVAPRMGEGLCHMFTTGSKAMECGVKMCLVGKDVHL